MMIRNVSSRRGSALLIVLGMVAFMVISAVAFSAYMRFSRLPSSYLRRTVASRMLAKAALASAIDEIDAAIGNNPHPGVNWRRSGLPDRFPRNATNLVGNVWMGRVYIGTNVSIQAGARLAAQQETVSPLCLEGLAYIPPPLVNEARWYSRHSGAARWKWLPYDVGRYAFCAIDVSDYFDINAVGVGARNSSSYASISMAYLFEDVNHMSSGGDCASWENSLRSMYTAGGKVPFVSMADWNLMVHAQPFAGLFSPFCEYVANNKATFNEGDYDWLRKVGNMPFVTDSYLPDEPSSGDDGPYYLDRLENQPFQATEEGIVQGKTAFQLLTMGSGATRESVWKRYFGLIGSCTLYDYLDYDSVPCSLALPTCERVPMVCGLNLALPQLSLAVTPTPSPVQYGQSQPKQNGQVEERTVDFTYTYTLDGATFMTLAGARLQTLLAYPFRHDDGLPVETFQVDGWMSLFFSSQQMGLRTGNMSDVLHFSDNLANLNAYQVAPNNNAIISVPFASQPISFNLKAADMQQAVDQELARVKPLELVAAAPTSIAGDIAARKLCEIVFHGTQRRTKVPNAMGGFSWSEWEPKEEDLLSNPLNEDFKKDPCNAQVTTTSDFIPLIRSGVRQGDVNAEDYFGETGEGLVKILARQNPLQLYLNVAAWVRVRNQEGKTVDLVPACMSDDSKVGLGVSVPQMCQQLDNQFFGSVFPLMRFDTGLSLDYGAKIEATPGTTWQQPPPAVVADPRYNHAPESWFVPAGSLTQLQTSWMASAPLCWLNECHARDVDRDGDIFMSVSDQGYLQSIYELANLPRLSQFYTDVNSLYGLGSTGGELYQRPDSAWTQNTLPLTFGTTANNKLMWRTYDPFPRGGNRFCMPGTQYGRENGLVYDWNSNGDIFDPTMLDNPDYKCFLPPPPRIAVNPYSDGTNLLVAALANTPHEWRLAGTNLDCRVIKDGGLPEDASSFNAEYAWNQYSQGARINWGDLNEFIVGFTNEVRETVARTDPRSSSSGIDRIDQVWKDVWDNLPWTDVTLSSDQASKELCGVPLLTTTPQGRIYNTDRKFLYGYWRNCFAVKQQLFLVFVRAEPAMMGGDAPGATPPQLGVKAVALVWRDPSWALDDGNVRNMPHRTRVLFYRQFE